MMLLQVVPGSDTVGHIWWQKFCKSRATPSCSVQNCWKPLTEASVLLKSSFVAAKATYVLTLSLACAFRKIIWFGVFQNKLSFIFSFICMNVLIFSKESEKKKKSQHFIAGQKLSQLHAKPFFNSSFCRRESRITLCQHIFFAFPVHQANRK